MHSGKHSVRHKVSTEGHKMTEGVDVDGGRYRVAERIVEWRAGKEEMKEHDKEEKVEGRQGEAVMLAASVSL